MNCFYCALITARDPSYPGRAAVHNLGSPAPRCARHWRHMCEVCRGSAHFMSMAYCPARRAYYCRGCAPEQETIGGRFHAWEYYFRYRSPWTNTWQPSLDRLEFEQRHPHQVGDRLDSPGPTLVAAGDLPYHAPAQHWSSVDGPLDDLRVRELWDKNASQWDAGFDLDGDEHRKYHTDESMFALIPDLAGTDLLDVGCGNGYLSRKLASMGARVTGVEISGQMITVARQHEARQRLGIRYLTASATSMPMLADASFDGVFQNHLLTSVGNLNGALCEAHRVLRPGGRLSVVISHPCFSCGPRQWVLPAPDSPRLEEAIGFAVDGYFRAGSYLFDAWAGFSPIPYFHRTLGEYWREFRAAGFTVDDFVEPSVSNRGRAELPPWQVRQDERIPFSCIFQMSKSGAPR